MQFDFGNGYDYSPLRDGLPENNIIYTGTHDNQTIQSWYYELNPHLTWCVNQYFGIENREKAYLNIIEGTMKTPPFVAIIPLQDYLGLTDDQGRMNIPSTLGCNWRWRCKREDYSDELAAYIYRITKESNRL